MEKLTLNTHIAVVHCVPISKMNEVQAALIIQRAWKSYWICYYCGNYRCGGIYSKFNCSEMFEEYELAKLDAYIDRKHGRW